MVDQEFKEFFMCQTFDISLIYDVWVKMTISWIIEQKKRYKGFSIVHIIILHLFIIYSNYIHDCISLNYHVRSMAYIPMWFFFLFFFITKSVHSEYIIIEHTCIINFFFSFHFTVVRIENEICQGETRRRRNMCWIDKDFSFELKRYRHLNFVKSTSAIIKSQPGLFSFKSSP